MLRKASHSRSPFSLRNSVLIPPPALNCVLVLPVSGWPAEASVSRGEAKTLLGNHDVVALLNGADCVL